MLFFFKVRKFVCISSNRGEAMASGSGFIRNPSSVDGGFGPKGTGQWFRLGCINVRFRIFRKVVKWLSGKVFGSVAKG